MNKGNNYIRAINNLDLRVYEGERIGLIGHNGAGEVTKVLQNKFDEVISGNDLNYLSWLTYTK